MPDEPAQEQFREILENESDTFRLAIRGFAVIEREMDAAILEAFTGDLPNDNVRQHRRIATRLTLAVALGIVAKQSRPAIKAVADVRNDFADGAASEITPQRLQAIKKQLRAFSGSLPDDKRMRDERFLDARE
jgi:hypothetical protein